MMKDTAMDREAVVRKAAEVFREAPLEASAEEVADVVLTAINHFSLLQQLAEAREALQRIADRPGPLTVKEKRGIGEYLHEEDHMARIARAALKEQQHG